MKIWMTNLHGMGGTAGLAQSVSMDIAETMGFEEMSLFCNKSGEDNVPLNARLDGICSGIEENDVVIVQLPSWVGLRYDERLLERIKSRMPSSHIIIFIHDIEPFVFGNWDALNEWLPLYNKAEVLIVPNHFMKEYLVGHGCTCKKFVYQHVWDNPSNLRELQTPISSLKKLVQFPGDPSKFEFVNSWPGQKYPLHYYSNEKSQNANLRWHHSLANEHLVLQMHRLGGYGILWEPPKRMLYMSMNTSMKFGAYMSAGLPVILHKGIAQEEIVKKYHLGKAVASVEEAADFVAHTDENEYAQMAANVHKIGKLTRNGYFTKRALMKAVYEALNND